MVKVITYGTYDLFHYGHRRLLERAKELGDYLIVGVTSDDFDKTRGKINVQQNLEERIAAVRATGIADKVIVEEYEGQKIDDIRNYNVDIFTVGSDWEGYFDYLEEYCKVVYLPRTEGISSSQIRSLESGIKLGIVGYSAYLNKFYDESKYVNAVRIVGLCASDTSKVEGIVNEIDNIMDDYDTFLNYVDAVYIHSHPRLHYEQCKKALEKNKHVLCESPLSMEESECIELIELSKKKNCVLMEGIRTAYLTAYSRLLLLVKSGKIGKVVSVDSTCTSLSSYNNFGDNSLKWGALEAWGPTALLPVLQILGTEYVASSFFSLPSIEYPSTDGFGRINLLFNESTASIKVGMCAKSESDLVITGTKGYVYVPAPWWKTDYFEIRYENPADNKRYFYQVDGEGSRYELARFVSSISEGKADYFINRDVTIAISKLMQGVRDGK